MTIFLCKMLATEQSNRCRPTNKERLSPTTKYRLTKKAIHVFKISIAILYRLTKSIRMSGVKYFIAGHDGHKVLCVAQIDDIVRPAGNHENRLDFVT